LISSSKSSCRTSAQISSEGSAGAVGACSIATSLAVGNRKRPAKLGKNSHEDSIGKIAGDPGFPLFAFAQGELVECFASMVREKQAERRPQGAVGSVRQLAAGVRVRRRGRDQRRRLPLSHRKGDGEMEMHNPAHPGEIVREECLRPLGLTVTAAADALGITRKALSDLLNGHTGVSPDMAIRLEKVFGSTADTWLRMQMQRDLWEARQRTDKIKVNKRFAAPALC
jgi:antitoxin HigA-1